MRTRPGGEASSAGGPSAGLWDSHPSGVAGLVPALHKHDWTTFGDFTISCVTGRRTQEPTQARWSPTLSCVPNPGKGLRLHGPHASRQEKQPSAPPLPSHLNLTFHRKGEQPQLESDGGTAGSFHAAVKRQDTVRRHPSCCCCCHRAHESPGVKEAEAATSPWALKQPEGGRGEEQPLTGRPGLPRASSDPIHGAAPGVCLPP